MKTPYEKFKSIPDASQYLKACVTCTPSAPVEQNDVIA
jgi:hypothetical protein